MRIISGQWKGKKLHAPKNLPTRPTTDFAKEGLFNVLNNYYFLNEINVLDLFAGIGSIGFEFASRGAQKITAVEQNTKCVKFITQTAAQLSFDQINVIPTDVFKFLKQPAQPYDIVFADPPYNLDIEKYNLLIQQVLENDWLATNGFFILEHANEHSFKAHTAFEMEKKYSNVHFSFFNTVEN